MENLNYEKVFNALVEHTADYVTNNHLKSMVLGISGGIDSTVVAAICSEVSERRRIPLIGRSLPIKNKEDEFDVSKLVGEAFCDEFKCIPLQNSYMGFLNNLMFEESQMYIHSRDLKEAEASAPDMQTPIANGNIQARLRMTYLYNLASVHKGIVMSTDNQTEYQLGFWTLHGDVGDFDPIQDLWKTEVYGLAQWLKDFYFLNEDKVTAIEESMKLTPTDGLGISNSDLDQIGAKSYAEVDSILQDFQAFTYLKDYDWKTSLREKADDYLGQHQMLNIPLETIINVIERHVASAFKRSVLPVHIPRYTYDY